MKVEYPALAATFPESSEKLIVSQINWLNNCVTMTTWIDRRFADLPLNTVAVFTVKTKKEAAHEL